VRLTTYHPCSAEHQEIQGLNLPRTPVGLLGLSVGVTLLAYKTSVLQCEEHAYCFLAFMELSIMNLFHLDKL
jgi:hypothetical protein